MCDQPNDTFKAT